MKPEKTEPDPIVEQVRAEREALAAAVGFDFGRIVSALRALEAAERLRGREVLAPPVLAPGPA